MNVRHLLHALRWAIMVVAALFVAGAFPFSSSGADGLTGTSGPITVTVTSDAGGLASVHAVAPDGVVIYSLTGHICMPGKVNGDHTFDFAGPFCSSVPVGQSDVEKIQAFPGVSAADLQFQLGTGTANWIDGRGFPRTLTCDPTNPCDLAIRFEITNSTAYFTAPFTWGTPLTEPPPAAPAPSAPLAADGGDGGGGTGGGASGGTGSATGAKPTDSCGQTASATTTAADPAASSTTTTAPESTCGKNGKQVPGGGSTSGSGSGGTGATAAGTSHSSSQGNGDNLAAAREASSISAVGVDSSRGVRVFVAAVLGALCGARILAVIGRTRRRLGTA